jgi:DNA-binding protein HU-beta
MTKAELVAAMADKTGMSRDGAKKALDAFTDCVVAALKKGEDVRLVGFGTFLPVKRAAGTARNPRTGQTVQRPASKTARFRVGEGLKGALNGR